MEELILDKNYEILGVNKNASDEEIKMVYKKLVKKYHPDRHVNNPLAELAEEQFKKINNAYEAISEYRKNKKKFLNKNSNNSNNHRQYRDDSNEFDKFGFDKEGYDREGYDRKGFDKFGFDKFGFDKEGYDRKGFDKEGYDREGYDREGFDKEGYDREGYDRKGYGSVFGKNKVESRKYNQEKQKDQSWVSTCLIYLFIAFIIWIISAL